MDKIEGKILIVDDDPGILQSAKVVLRQSFTSVQIEQNPKQIPYWLNNFGFNVVLLDMNYTAGDTSGKEGLQWLTRIKEISPECQVIMITAYGQISLAVEAMKFGATDFVVKPWENEKLKATVTSALHHNRSIREVNRLKSKQTELSLLLSANENFITGESPAIKDIVKIIEKVADTDANILIYGENGTGKEVLAKAIHQLSSRKNSPFVKVDVGSISPTLFESELFGHKKGAFTDAGADKKGRIEIAHGGTLFLDEIANIAPELQAKLLSVLQNRTIIPVGSSKEIPIDIRIISASNMNLNAMVKTQEFREDLLYRLKTVEILLPPLRERREDIPLFARHFFDYYKLKYRKTNLHMDKGALGRLVEHPWPGNIRELQHAIERSVIMAEKPLILADDFPLTADPSRYKIESLKLEEVEKEAIKEAIAKYAGNISKAAKELGLGRTTLYRKIEKYGL